MMNVRFRGWQLANVVHHMPLPSPPPHRRPDPGSSHQRHGNHQPDDRECQEQTHNNRYAKHAKEHHRNLVPEA
jgi:hypothetical protein